MDSPINMMDSDPTVNVLVKGLDFHTTICVPASTSASVSDIYDRVAEHYSMLQRESPSERPRLEPRYRFNLALPNRTRLDKESRESIGTYLPSSQNSKQPTRLSLHMKLPLPGSIPMVNVMVRGFKGLNIPGRENYGNTYCVPLPASSTIRKMHEALAKSMRFPSTWFDGQVNGPSPLMITTMDSRRVDRDSQQTVSSLLSSTEGADFLTVNVTPRILGGKGGFGSQLRAAGGRMSSRKNRNQTAEQQNASNRNLDGRRIRTITEAKNLAAYLAMKPDMDKKEREERRKRWEAVVEAAERKEEEVKRGKGSTARLDGQWVEQKEEVENKTRDAVLAAMKAGFIGNEAIVLGRTGSESSGGEDGDSDEAMEGEASGSSVSSASEEKATTSKPAPAAPAARTFFGWDEDDEDMSDEEDEEEDEIEPVAYEGKGKGKA